MGFRKGGALLRPRPGRRGLVMSSLQWATTWRPRGAWLLLVPCALVCGGASGAVCGGRDLAVTDLGSPSGPSADLGPAPTDLGPDPQDQGPGPDADQDLGCVLQYEVIADTWTSERGHQTFMLSDRYLDCAQCVFERIPADAPEYSCEGWPRLVYCPDHIGGDAHDWSIYSEPHPPVAPAADEAWDAEHLRAWQLTCVAKWARQQGAEYVFSSQWAPSSNFSLTTTVRATRAQALQICPLRTIIKLGSSTGCASGA